MAKDSRWQVAANGAALHAAAAAFCFSHAGGRTMNDAKADCQALMLAAIPFAEEMLTSEGAFIPFGGAMKPDGQIAMVAGCDGNENPRSTDIMELMKSGFVADARAGTYKATAMVYDVRVTLPSTREKSDAIAVALNHRDNYSTIVLVPYKIDNGELILGTIFAQKGEADIFPTQ